MIKQKIQPWAVLLLSTLLVLPVTGFSGSSTVHAATDTQHHWAKQVLNDWQNKGYISGFEDGSLKPDQSVTRSQLAALINKAYGFTHAASIQYTDVQPSDWYYNDVAIAKAEGYMEGYKDSTFHPNKQVSRQELAVILTSLKKLKSSNSASTLTDTANSPSWSKGSIGAVIDSGLMKGDEKGFRPKDTTTRAEAVTVLDRSLQAATSAATVYNTAGVYGPASGQQSLSGNVQLNAAGSTLRNTIVEGDLILGEGIGEGDILLDHVTVKGTTTINGGGSHSIHLEDSAFTNVIVNKKSGDVRIITAGSTTIQQLLLQSGATLEEETSTSSGFSNVILSSFIPSGSTVSMKGHYDAVDVASSNVNIQLNSGAVDQLAVSANAINNRINLPTAASIGTLSLNAPTTVNGNGTIHQAYIRSSGVTITPKVGQTTLSDGITAKVQGDTLGLPQATTNIKKDDDKDKTSTTPVPEVIQPQSYNLDVTNGKAILPAELAYAGLNMSDMKITFTLDGKPYSPSLLTSLHYDSASHSLQFAPFIVKEVNYGKIVQITVEPSGPSSLLKASLKGSFRIHGAVGRITDLQGEPVHNMLISFRRGMDVRTGPIVTTTESGYDGEYRLDLPPGVYTGELQKDGYLITYVTVSVLAEEYTETDAVAIPKAGQDQIRIVLTWGEFPQDEDAHLTGPAGDGYGFHISPMDENNYIYNDEVYAQLDQDQQKSYGPETITIRKRMDGQYMFYVTNYSAMQSSSAASLSRSSARVQVYVGDASAPMKTYDIPTEGGNETVWRVFDLDVKDGQLQFWDYNSLFDYAPYSPYMPVQNRTQLNELKQQLDDEVDLLPASLTLPYDTTPQQAVELITSGSDPEVGRTVTSINPVQTTNASTVTADAYLGASEYKDNLQLLQYNGSTVATQYDVTVQFYIDNLEKSRVIRITVPTIDTWLNEAAVEAQTLISRYGDEDTAQLQAAVARQQALTNDAITNDKIAVLEQLNIALSEW
ncbi:S-layer homology domain-containing protein [Paenibacillus sp. WLX1005]|uniref:S-layer homology domain-containing protein n=1 Tax=Paenibacillus sp. WLX1005 TaxID=3243766 RepID=UPI0039842D6F